ncbi:hypothetical protein POTOM_026179 [Populus tomentosa]|uniref:RRM domain-containing protein n=1 Tax=Populus tomentosa TaxID=118781 RepID=A0A8X8CXW5_POPTO|nr:hypothetical protein POTOM_026179 [Populus tomentosa]
MAEPYNIYDALQDRGSVSRLSFPGYVSTAAPPLASHSIPVSTEFPGASSDFLQRDINPLQLGSYGLNGYSGAGFHPEPVIGGVMPGARGKGYSSPLEDPSLLAQRGDASMHAIGGAIPGSTGKGYPSPLEDPGLLSQRGDASVHVTAAIPDMINDRPGSLRSADGPPVPKGKSNILFVDGLPTDCTRREVGRILIGYYPATVSIFLQRKDRYWLTLCRSSRKCVCKSIDLFRPFIGYKEIRVVHKEARKVSLLLQYLCVKDLSLPSINKLQSGDRATVLCFVEFTDANCAATAMEALQGYKFDDKKPDSPTLKIQFARFPFRSPSDRDGKRIGTHASYVLRRNGNQANLNLLLSSWNKFKLELFGFGLGSAVAVHWSGFLACGCGCGAPGR